MRRRALAVRAMALGGIVALGVSVSCATFDYPDSSCKADSVVKAAPQSTQAGCASCVEQSCCDPTGQCVDDGVSCLDPVHAMHACVVDGGPKTSVEANCGPALQGNAHARTLYTCMRDHCGAACDLPACHVDPAAALIVSSSCDQCFTDSCCGELNACYQNRACKLAVECIVTRCRNDLSAGLDFGSTTGLGGADVDTLQVCATSAALPPNWGGDNPAACITGCIAEFGAKDPSAALDPHQSAACLSTKIYQCAIRAGCAKSCAIPPDSDAGDGGAAGDGDAADAD